MTQSRNISAIAILLLAVSIIATGCARSETIAVNTDAPETTPASIDDGESDNGEPDGCCGKFKQEENIKQTTDHELASSELEGCGNCTTSTDGDSANCKCAAHVTTNEESENSETDAVETKSQGKGHQGHGQTANFPHDREVFHFLLANHDKVTREVKELENGVETLTESKDKAVVAKLQEHVTAMYGRVENGEPIRMRDPLYREVFKCADKIEMTLENTDNGIRVTETSDDEYVVKVIQVHAKVVTGFVEHGFEEAHRNHEPPKK